MALVLDCSITLSWFFPDEKSAFTEAALDLVALRDDRGFFPIYNPAIVVRRAVLREHPDLPDLLNPIARKLDGAGEAHLIALTCGDPPAGRERWTLRLLAQRMVTLEHVDALSHETVRRTLKKTNSSRG